MTTKTNISILRRTATLGLAAVLSLGLAGPAASADDEPTATSRTAGRGLQVGPESLLAEVAALPDHQRAEHTAVLRARWVATVKPSAGLELRAGIRTDVDHQGGGIHAFDKAQAALTDTFVRWRLGDARLTAGLQTVLWGRVDAVSLLDRVSRVDLRRFAIDELKERRLPQPIVRWEHSWGDLQSDLVLMPGHLDALLPQRDSVWHPVKRAESHILGTPSVPMLSAFYAAAPLQHMAHRQGGAALRLIHTGDGLDLGFTAGRVRQPLPFFTLDRAGNTIQASHPLSSFLAADFEFAGDAVTWRGELAHTRGVPMTHVATGALTRAHSTEFAGGAEFFPGGRDTRINLQLLLRAVHADVQTVELRRYASLSGEVETSLVGGKVKAGMRFATGLNLHDIYISPRVAYTGWEPHELYAAAHLFKGQQRGFGGFFSKTNALAIGVKTRF